MPAWRWLPAWVAWPWRTITTNLTLPTSPYPFIDLDSPGRPQRFYQAFPTP